MTLSEVEKNVLDSEEKNPEIAYKYLKSFKSDFVSLHSDNVYRYGTPELNYLFARDIPGAQVPLHQIKVIQSNDLELNYLFARDVKGCSISLHSSIILESKSPKYNYLFLRDVLIDLDAPRAQAHASIVRNSQDVEYINALNILIESRKAVKERNIRK